MRVTLTLTEGEYKVLVALGDQDLRGVLDEIRYLLREEAKRRGIAEEETVTLCRQP